MTCNHDLYGWYTTDPTYNHRPAPQPPVHQTVEVITPPPQGIVLDEDGFPLMEQPPQPQPYEVVTDHPWTEPVEGEPWPNWTGLAWIELPYTAPPPPVVVQDSPRKLEIIARLAEIDAEAAALRLELLTA